MIDKIKISVLMTTHASRYAGAREALDGWLEQPAAQIWLLDGGGAYERPKHQGRVDVFRMPFDLGTRMDMAMALLTEGDLICCADDDVKPQPGFLEDLYLGWIKTAGGISGILGRTFEGPTYWGNTTFYRARNIQEPVRVGFVGVVFLASRDLFGFDVRGCPRNCDDLWFQMKAQPDAPKWVIPTTKYEDLPSSKDGTAMYRSAELKAQRQEFYEAHYRMTYAPEGRHF